jgi:hypothetical protein
MTFIHILILTLILTYRNVNFSCARGCFQNLDYYPHIILNEDEAQIIKA